MEVRHESDEIPVNSLQVRGAGSRKRQSLRKKIAAGVGAFMRVAGTTCTLSRLPERSSSGPVEMSRAHWLQ
jgi:hypothetical protein